METTDIITHLALPFIIKQYNVNLIHKKTKVKKTKSIIIIHDVLLNKSSIFNPLNFMELEVVKSESIFEKIPISQDKHLITNTINKITNSTHKILNYKMTSAKKVTYSLLFELYYEDYQFKAWIGSDQYNLKVQKMSDSLFESSFHQHHDNNFYNDVDLELNQIKTVDLEYFKNYNFQFVRASEYVSDLDQANTILTEDTILLKRYSNAINKLESYFYNKYKSHRHITKLMDIDSYILIPYKVKLNILNIGFVTMNLCAKYSLDENDLLEIGKLEIPKAKYKLEKKYYIVQAKGGHVGRSYFLRIDLPIHAYSGKEAAAIARQMGRVKHNHMDAIISCREVTKEEYLSQIDKNNADPYFQVHSRHEQNKFKEDIEKRREIDNRNAYKGLLIES